MSNLPISEFRMGAECLALQIFLYCPTCSAEYYTIKEVKSFISQVLRDIEEQEAKKEVKNAD